MRAGLNAQFLGILLTLAGLLTFVLVLHNDFRDHSPAQNVFDRRQAAAIPGTVAAATTATDTPTSQAAATTATPAAATTQTSQQAATTPTTTPTTAAQKATPTQAPAQTTTTPTNAAPATKPTTPTGAQTSAIVTTDSSGQVVTSVLVVSDTASSTSAAPSQTTSGNPSSSDISTPTIIGLGVAGGVAVLCVVGFFVWKFTRKRGDFDSNEEIKWPELNTHDDNPVPLPTNRTGGAGFDTEGGRSSLGYAPSTAANSTAELHPDPYAVPPLPHLDPNQPYHDDPNGRYYDPYRGPVPQTFDHGEAIPMTQLAGHRSPAPPDFGGRASPAVPTQYGADFGGRASPGPRAPYAGGRMSPGPQAAYGGGNAYGPR